MVTPNAGRLRGGCTVSDTTRPNYETTRTTNIAQFDIGIRAMAYYSYYSRYNSTIDLYISNEMKRDRLMG